MIRMFVRHTVNDVAVWKNAYEEFRPVQEEMGVKAEAVFQSVDDPNDLTVWHDFESIEAARSFAQDPRLREGMEGAGVSGAPTIWFTRRS